MSHECVLGHRRKQSDDAKEVYVFTGQRQVHQCDLEKLLVAPLNICDQDGMSAFSEKMSHTLSSTIKPNLYFSVKCCTRLRTALSVAGEPVGDPLRRLSLREIFLKCPTLR